MTNRELITGYRDTVFLINSLQSQAAWNHQHGLPAQNITEKILQLVQDLIHFEDLMDTITDLRARNIISFLYVLGMNEHDTALSMGISRASVNRICAATLRSLEDAP